MASAKPKPTHHRRFHSAEIAGWYGMLAIIIAYGLASFNVVSADNYLFQGLNLTGSLCLMWISYKKRVAQTVVLNTFWALIALMAIGRLLLK